MGISEFQKEYLNTISTDVANKALRYYAQATGSDEAKAALVADQPLSSKITPQAINHYETAIENNIERLDQNQTVDSSLDPYPVERDSEMDEKTYQAYVETHNDTLRESLNNELDAISSTKRYSRMQQQDDEIDLLGGLADLSANTPSLGM